MFGLVTSLATVFAGGVAFVLYTRRHGPQAGRWMYVSTVDGSGWRIGRGQWRHVPEADHVAHGIEAVSGYIRRLHASRSEFASLGMFTPDGKAGLSVWKRGGRYSFHFAVDWRSETQQERAIREMFERPDVTTEWDYLAGNGGVPDATRVLSYHVAADDQTVAALCISTLKDIYHVRDHQGLDFRLEDHQVER